MFWIVGKLCFWRNQSSLSCLTGVWPVCGFRRRSRETTPASIPARAGPFLRGVWRAAIPCTKSSESDGFHDPFQKPDFPGKLRTTRRSETKQEKALTLLCVRAGTTSRSAGGFRGSGLTLFPLEITIFPVGKTFCRTLPSFPVTQMITFR